MNHTGTGLSKVLCPRKKIPIHILCIKCFTIHEPPINLSVVLLTAALQSCIFLADINTVLSKSDKTTLPLQPVDPEELLKMVFILSQFLLITELIIYPSFSLWFRLIITIFRLWLVLAINLLTENFTLVFNVKRKKKQKYILINNFFS